MRSVESVISSNSGLFLTLIIIGLIAFFIIVIVGIASAVKHKLAPVQECLATILDVQMMPKGNQHVVAQDQWGKRFDLSTDYYKSFPIVVGDHGVISFREKELLGFKSVLSNTSGSNETTHEVARMENHLICSRCGSPMPEGDRYCGRCGNIGSAYFR